jgi:hypothetical protein
MDDRLTPDRLAAEKRLRVKRRAKRGLIAGYIHGLSQRHRDDAAVGSMGTRSVAPSPVSGETAPDVT